MSFNRRMTRPDGTQAEIVQRLRQACVTVWVIGEPCDLLTYYRGRWLPLECKPKKPRKRTDQADQERFLIDYAVPVVRTFEEAYAAVTR
jgi:hypothetical protein